MTEKAIDAFFNMTSEAVKIFANKKLSPAEEVMCRLMFDDNAKKFVSILKAEIKEEILAELNNKNIDNLKQKIEI